MAVSSYGSGTKSSGVVRILKDLDTDISGRHVLIVEDIIDTGLTLSLADHQPELPRARRASRSARCCASPRRLQMPVDVKYVGFDIPNEFVVGYGLDYARAVPQPAATSAPSPRTSTADPAGRGRRNRRETRAVRVSDGRQGASHRRKADMVSGCWERSTPREAFSLREW